MILLRLSPLIPNHALDYISGVTSISVRDYSMALIGIMPSTIAFCYIGATASSVAEGKDNANKVHTTMLILGLVFALAGAILASYYAKQELDKILHVNNTNNNNICMMDQNDGSGYYNHTNHQRHMQQPHDKTIDPVCTTEAAPIANVIVVPSFSPLKDQYQEHQSRRFVNGVVVHNNYGTENNSTSISSVFV